MNLKESLEKELSKVRGKEIGFIFQDPMTSLTPHMTIGDQLIEVSICHENANKSESLNKAKNVLDIVKLPRIESLINKYPKIKTYKIPLSYNFRSNDHHQQEL